MVKRTRAKVASELECVRKLIGAHFGRGVQAEARCSDNVGECMAECALDVIERMSRLMKESACHSHTDGLDMAHSTCEWTTFSTLKACRQPRMITQTTRLKVAVDCGFKYRHRLISEIAERQT